MSQSNKPVLINVLQTVHEMIEKRGYKIRDKYQWEFNKDGTRNDFKMIDKIKNDPITVWADRKTPEDSLIVFFFIENGKFGIGDWRNIVKIIKEKKINHFILVLPGEITPSVSKELKNYNAEVFNIKELFVNINNHKLVPKHELMSPDEFKTLIDSGNLDEKIESSMKKTIKFEIMMNYPNLDSQFVEKFTELRYRKYYANRVKITSTKELPKILTSDPIAKYHKWDIGSIIKITRYLGDDVEPSVYYRVVEESKD